MVDLAKIKTMKKLFNKKKWLIIAALVFLLPAELLAATKPKRHGSKIDERRTYQKEFSQQIDILNVAAEETKKICEAAGLNPKQGLGDIYHNLKYSYDAVFKTRILGEPEFVEQRKVSFEQMYAGKIEEERRTHQYLFTPGMLAEFIYKEMGGYDAVKYFLDRQAKGREICFRAYNFLLVCLNIEVQRTEI